jgi:hypothetical protein
VVIVISSITPTRWFVCADNPATNNYNTVMRIHACYPPQIKIEFLFSIHLLLKEYQIFLSSIDRDLLVIYYGLGIVRRALLALHNWQGKNHGKCFLIANSQGNAL